MKKSGRCGFVFSGWEAVRKAEQLYQNRVYWNQWEIMLKIMWETNCKEARMPD